MLEFPQVFFNFHLSPWAAAGRTWGTADSLYVLYDTGIAASIIIMYIIIIALTYPCAV